MASSVAGERRPVDKIELKPGAHVHLMGICGTAMASLAGLLKSRGYKVTGSDQNVYPPMSTQLEKIGISIMPGYKRENLAVRPDLVIVGNVITRKHEEAVALLESDIPFTSLPQAMGALLIADRHSVVVAGTHGKTTTTALNAFVADRLGLDPGFMVGGIPKNFDLSYRATDGDWFVIEGDEYDTAFFDKVPKFIHYRPRSVILNSVEFDHADIYRDLDHVKEAFFMLLDLIPTGGRLIACSDEATIRDLLVRRNDSLRSRGVQVLTFGLDESSPASRGENHYRASDLRAVPVPAPLSGAGAGAGAATGAVHGARLGTEFILHRPKGAALTVRLPMIGSYNVKNAMATLALWESLGHPAEKVAPLLLEFAGVKRRQEVLGTPGGITVIEDFAHHPTAVQTTIQTVQMQYPKAQVYSVFEARSATSRRKVFQREYAEAFANAQHVLFPPAFSQTGIDESDRFSMQQLIDDLHGRGVDARLLANVDTIVADIRSRARPGDVVLVMSNGAFDGIYQKLLTELAR